MSQEDEAYALKHFGVKGMRWGVRKEETSSPEGPKSAEEAARIAARNKKIKKAVIIGGSVITVAAVTAGTIYMAKHGGLPIHSFNSSQVKKGESFVKEFAAHIPKEPTEPIVGTRGKNLGYHFMMKGGLTDPLHEFEKSGINNAGAGHGFFRQYGGKVAVAFIDPEGRKDFAGRPIVHQVVLPSHHAAGITNFESAQKKAWTLIKDEYGKFWQKSIPRDARM